MEICYENFTLEFCQAALANIPREKKVELQWLNLGQTIADKSTLSQQHRPLNQMAFKYGPYYDTITGLCPTWLIWNGHRHNTWAQTHEWKQLLKTEFPQPTCGLATLLGQLAVTGNGRVLSKGVYWMKCYGLSSDKNYMHKVNHAPIPQQRLCLRNISKYFRWA